VYTCDVTVCVPTVSPMSHLAITAYTLYTTRNLPSKCYFYTFYTCFTHFAQLCENTCVQLCFLPVKHCFSHFFAQCLYSVHNTHFGDGCHTQTNVVQYTLSENMIFNIFHEKLAQKSSVFIKIMKLFTTCVFNICLKSCVHRKYHITAVNQKY
jgi:hypothetical protein